MSDKHLSAEDVHNVVSEHLNKLDQLWPDSDLHGPRKVHIVELIDAMKLRLYQIAEKNANKYESPFEIAARKITGTNKRVPAPAQTPEPQGKSAMQLAHEAAKARMKSARD